VIVTDHNVWVNGMDGYRYLDRDRVLLLTGEEVHDQGRTPQKNHMLIYEVFEELAPHAVNPQEVIDRVHSLGGLTFLAHPIDPAAPAFGEDDLSWEDWDIEGFTGIELWNYMSEFKSRLTSKIAGLFFAYFPARIAIGPFPGLLARWDRMTSSGHKVVIIGGSDAHATPYRLGPLKRVIFPYEALFNAVNTHVFLSEPLTGDADIDRRRIFHSIREGRCFVGYDLPASTRGFRFTAHGDHAEADMGETIRLRLGITLQVKLPRKADLRLLRDGELLSAWTGVENAVTTVSRPGVYRIEAYLRYHGRDRGWIFSNPIYVVE
jgi:hypothetical protein